MQIHELNTFSGTPTETDFLPIDTGFDTAKISAPELLRPLKEQADLINSRKVNNPIDEDNQPVYGTPGQLLKTNGDGSTEWVDEGLPTDEQTAQAISDWLDAHPEATTTVLDGSITKAKLNSSFRRSLSVNVEDFSGANNREKIQNAIDYAIDNNCCVVFTQVYDITGLGSIEIVKPPAGHIDIDTKYGDYLARTLYIIGEGGGIKKDDAGFIFSNSDNNRVSDIDISGMRFSSECPTYENGVFVADGVSVWDGKNFIRVYSHNNVYQGIFNVLRSDATLVQSMRFDSEIIRGGNSYAFYFNSAIDLTIENCLIEERYSAYQVQGGGIANKTIDAINYVVRILNNCIEGCDLEAIKLSPSISTIIRGNYFEKDSGYIDLFGLVNTGYNICVEISENYILQSATQITNNAPSISIKRPLIYGDEGNSLPTVSVLGNRSNGRVLEVNGGRVVSDKNYSTVSKMTNSPRNSIPSNGVVYVQADPGVGVPDGYLCGTCYVSIYSVYTPCEGNDTATITANITNALFGQPLTEFTVLSFSYPSGSPLSVENYVINPGSGNVSQLELFVRNSGSTWKNGPLKITAIRPYTT